MRVERATLQILSDGRAMGRQSLPGVGWKVKKCNPGVLAGHHPNQIMELVHVLLLLCTPVSHFLYQLQLIIVQPFSKSVRKNASENWL